LIIGADTEGTAPSKPETAKGSGLKKLHEVAAKILATLRAREGPGQSETQILFGSSEIRKKALDSRPNVCWYNVYQTRFARGTIAALQQNS
jgi:hypothetical protein